MLVGIVPLGFLIVTVLRKAIHVDLSFTLFHGEINVLLDRIEMAMEMEVSKVCSCMADMAVFNIPAPPLKKMGCGALFR